MKINLTDVSIRAFKPPIQGQLTIHPSSKLIIRVGDQRFHSISIRIDLRSKRKSVRFRFLHHPSQRRLSKKIGLIATADIRVSAYKPALLNAGERTRLGHDGVWIFRMMDVPERGSEVVAMLIDGKGVIAVQDVDAQSCLQIIELSTAKAPNIASPHTDGSDGIPNPARKGRRAETPAIWIVCTAISATRQTTITIASKSKQAPGDARAG
jgi:hypothetical protein